MNEKLYRALIGRAKADRKSIAIPEATNEKMLTAARRVYDEGVAQPILVGVPEEIGNAAAQYGISLEGLKVVNLMDEAVADAVVGKYLAINDLFSEKSLRRKAKDPLNFACMLVAVGEADSVFAGINYSTGDVVFAGQVLVGLKEGIQGASSVGIMDIPGYEGSEGNLLAVADCAVCAQPDPSMLADIAITSCETMRELLGWEPKAAMVSFSTDGSAEHEMIDKLREAVKIAHQKRPDLKIDGEFQLDAAVNPGVAAKKVRRDSDVAGKANIAVFPDLNVGNVAVKVVQLMAHGDAIGPLLQGFARPVADCSRNASVEELVANMVILAVRAQ